MNYKMVGFVLGRIFLIEAALMLFPMGCAAIYGEWSVVLSFLWPTLIVTFGLRSFAYCTTGSMPGRSGATTHTFASVPAASTIGR